MTSNHSWDVAKASAAGSMANFLTTKILSVDEAGSLQPSRRFYRDPSPGHYCLVSRTKDLMSVSKSELRTNWI